MEWKICFEGFKKVLELCVEKKYGNKDDVQKLIDKICGGKGLVIVGVMVRYCELFCLLIGMWFCDLFILGMRLILIIYFFLNYIL